MELWYRASIHGVIESFLVTRLTDTHIWYYERHGRSRATMACRTTKQTRWFKTEAEALQFVGEYKLQQAEVCRKRALVARLHNAGPLVLEALELVLGDQQNFLTQESYRAAKTALDAIRG